MELQSANLHQHDVTRQIEKGWSFNDSMVKNVIAYTTTVILIPASVTFLFSSLPAHFSTETARYSFALVYLLCGIAHIFIFPKWLPNLDGIKGFIYTILLSAAISLIVVFVFIITSFKGGLLPLAAASAFILPTAINLCWQYFSGITSTVYSEWHMPADMKPEKRMSLLLNSIYFRIKIKEKENSTEATIFTVTLSGKLTMGSMFCRFLYDQQEGIEIKQSGKAEYGWRFYSQGWLGLRPLDPGKSLLENGIKDDDIILIERVKK